MRVAFFADRWANSNLPLIRGLARVGLQQRPAWRITVESGEASYLEQDGLPPGFDAVVFKTPNSAHVAVLESTDKPLVVINADPATTRLPNVNVDNQGVGRVAAEHLRSQGHRRFAFVGLDNWWSRERFDGFAAAARGLPLHTNGSAAGDWPEFAWATDPDRVGGFLSTLTFPVGLLACFDDAAATVVEAALARGIRVPEDLAVVGVNNDELRCLGSPVAISSVDTAMEAAGERAGRVLLDVAAGRSPSGTVRAPCEGVVVRRSSDHLAVDDADLADAIRLIREQATDGRSLEEILDRVPVSRRTLERRFRAALGHSPHDELRRVRLSLARRMMWDTHLSLTEIGHRCGYFDSAHFSHDFKREFRVTPTAFRRRKD